MRRCVGIVHRFAKQVAVEHDDRIGAEHDAGFELRRHGAGLPLGDRDRLGFGIEPGIDGLRRIADDGLERNAELGEEGDDAAVSRRPGSRGTSRLTSGGAEEDAPIAFWMDQRRP